MKINKSNKPKKLNIPKSKLKSKLISEYQRGRKYDSNIRSRNHSEFNYSSAVNGYTMSSVKPNKLRLSTKLKTSGGKHGKCKRTKDFANILEHSEM